MVRHHLAFPDRAGINVSTERGQDPFKTELIRPQGPWRGLDDLEIATLEYIDWFNHRRLHGELGMITPTEAEATYYRDHAPQQHAERAEPSLH